MGHDDEMRVLGALDLPGSGFTPQEEDNSFSRRAKVKMPPIVDEEGSEGDPDPNPETYWNYRVMKFSVPLPDEVAAEVGDATEDEFAIVEVHYLRGEIVGWGGPVAPGGDTLEDLGSQLVLMQMALSEPVLNEADYPDPEVTTDGDGSD